MDVREKSSNEKRLIDANAFLKDILTAGIGKTIIEYSESDIGYMILKRPTEDAVEVVRCRDCKHYKPQKKSAHWENRTNYCNRIVTIKVQPYDFCSYGERKEGAD